MPRRTLSLLLLLALLSFAPVISRSEGGRISGPAIALVQVPLPDHDALIRFQRTGLPAYARLHGNQGDYLLLGAGPDEQAQLQAAGLTVRILDPDLQGVRYYLEYAASAPADLRQAGGGRLLLDDGLQAVLRLSPTEVHNLAAAGVELSALPSKPKPLQPTFAPGTIAAVADPDPLVQSLIEQVDSNTVYQYTGDLSGEWPVEVGGQPFTIASRYTYSGIYIDKATQFVGEHLAALGLDVEYHVWDDPRYPNVIGELLGETNPQDIYIICAHLDDAPFENLAPGADDNASGSVAVLIAADILSQYQWDNTLRFVLFTGEEQWSMEEYYAHGSYAYVQRAYNLGENIVGVLDLDMIGWNSEFKPEPGLDLEAKSTPELSPTVELAQLFVDVVDAYDLDLEPEILAHSGGLGDHGSFWDYGYVAIMGIEDLLDFNPFYHTINDRLIFLDLDYFTEFVKASVGTFAHMSLGSRPPRERHNYYLPLVVRQAQAP